MKAIALIGVVVFFVWMYTFRGCGPRVKREIEYTIVGGYKDTICNTANMEPRMISGFMQIHNGKRGPLGNWEKYPYVVYFRVIKSDTIQ